MKRVRVFAGPSPYDVLIGPRVLGHPVLARVLGPQATGVVVSSRTVMRLHGAALQAALQAAGFDCRCLVLLADGESAKSVAQWNRVTRAMAQARLDRSSFVVAFGGGSIGDVAGFAAATYLRGIRVIQVPTTLLAMVDSSVGGKTAVNLREGKNLVGAFHQPSLVLSDLALLNTLPVRERQSGAFEVLKCGILRSAALVELIIRTRGLRAASEADLESAIAQSVAIKAKIVKSDEKEEGHRILLNFGHTLGHALEAATAYRLHTHGEAVGYGMEFAIDLSEATGLIAEPLARRLRFALDRLGSKAPIDRSKHRAIATAILGDKKRRGRGLDEILISRIGHPAVRRFEGEALCKLVRAWLDARPSRDRPRT